MKRGVALLLVLFALSFEGARAAVCSNKVQGLLREITLEVTPTYFIRVDTNSKKIFMSGDCVLSLETGKCVSRGRTWEPYPISGMGLVTVPHCDGDRSMCFYKTDSFKNMTESEPILVDKGMDGYYQSVGFLKKTADTADVRVLSYYGSFRDYKISKGTVVEPKGDKVKFCSGQEVKLPMLSKDGAMLSSWNPVTEKTVIYNLAKDGSCKVFYELNYMVSKMDFSYDNKYVAFHATSDTSGKIGESLELQQQIFIMDLKTKKIVKVSSGAEILYYPHFGENGLMYALKFNKSENKYSVLEIDPVKATKTEGADGAGFCIDCSAEKQKSLFKLDCVQ